MRPVRIKVEGFAAYRKSVEVDFADVEFFSLTGPTGSGKSSLIDAMVFALYGRVPRLGGNTLSPAISAGSDRARVLFDFAVGDEVYTAVRMAQRTTTGGASVREARLQRAETVIADGADDVTTAVESLLRLRFEDFTRTVVLPQGEFARFLTATKAERQGLLRNLLGFEIYTRVRDLARTRSVVAEERARAAQKAIDALDLPETETVELARNRRDTLAELTQTVAARARTLNLSQAEHDELTAKHSKLAAQLERLEAIQAPPRLEELETLIVNAREEVADTATSRERADQAVVELAADIDKHPSPQQIALWLQMRSKLAELDTKIESVDIATAKSDVVSAESELGKAQRSATAAAEELARARNDHAAHLLAGRLVEGEPCPVCANPVSTLPQTRSIPGLEHLEEADSRASGSVETARETLVNARLVLESEESRRADLMARKDELVEELNEAPGDDELERLRAGLEELHARLEKARQDLADSKERHRAAEKSLEDLADDSRRLTRTFNTAQLSVAELDPPVPEADDVIVQWKELMAWRDTKTEEVRGTLDRVDERVIAKVATLTELRSGLVSDLEKQGVDALEPYEVQVATALASARSLVETYEKAAQEVSRLDDDLAKAQEEQAVAETLASHLRSNGFEQWLMAGALHDLVAGANDLLDQLSGGGYSLQSDDAGAFSIVDHHNADETRPVATLSGGETFLVSMALALSLAETLAAKGGSGLDAIILDEGFGSLDDETLDTVAAVLEELAGSGLMVGVITHVKDLAARAPVRYEVTRQPEGATVMVTS